MRAVLLVLALAAGSCQSAGTEGLKTPVEGSEAELARGVWGGDHLRMEVGDTGVALEFDCAHATLPVRPALDEQGRFEADGSFVQERPGPGREGDAGAEHPARFEGTVDGTKLSLTILLTDTKETLGPYALTLGVESRLTKCL